MSPGKMIRILSGLRRKPGRGTPSWTFPRGRGTGVPGQLPASVGSTCNPPGREAASAAGGPLQRQDGGPRSAACFYRKCLLSAWPLSGFGGGGAAAAEGRGSPVGCLLLVEVPAIRLAAERLRRGERPLRRRDGGGEARGDPHGRKREFYVLKALPY